MALNLLMRDLRDPHMAVWHLGTFFLGGLRANFHSRMLLLLLAVVIGYIAYVAIGRWIERRSQAVLVITYMAQSGQVTVVIRGSRKSIYLYSII